MALATETTQGEIVLAGDLAGDGGAQTGSSPQLTHIGGLTAGSYDPAQVTVDAKGRITAISSTISTDINTYIPDATTSSKGVMQVGAGLSVASGVVSVDTLTLPDATESSKGIMQVGTGLDVTAGVVSVDWTEVSIPDASEVTKGLMQVGSGLSVASGIVSVDPGSISLPDATTSTKGIMQVGTGLDVTAGVVSVDFTEIPDATEASKGLMQVGTGLDVTAGVVSVNVGEIAIPDATTSTKGIMQVGNYLNVSTGIVNVDLAENATAGAVYSNDTDHINIVSGAVDIGAAVAVTDTSQAFTGAQYTTPTTLTAVSNIASVDGALSNVFTLTLSDFTVLAYPSNDGIGQIYTFIIKQDATGGRVLSFDAGYKFRQGVVPTASTAANAVDVMTCVGDGTNMFCNYNKGFV